jgi:hypothetical protein
MAAGVAKGPEHAAVGQEGYGDTQVGNCSCCCDQRFGKPRAFISASLALACSIIWVPCAVISAPAAFYSIPHTNRLDQATRQALDVAARLEADRLPGRTPRLKFADFAGCRFESCSGQDRIVHLVDTLRTCCSRRQHATTPIHMSSKVTLLGR